MKKMFNAIIASVIVLFGLSCSGLIANAAEKYTYTFSVVDVTGTKKYDCYISSDKPVVAVNDVTSSSDLSRHYYEMTYGTNFIFYTLDSTGTNLTTVKPIVTREYTYENNAWTLSKTYDSSSISYLTTSNYAFGQLGYGAGYYDFTGSGLDILKVNIKEKTVVTADNGTEGVNINYHNLNNNILSYLLKSTFVDVPGNSNYIFKKYTSADNLTPSFAYRNYGTSFYKNSSFTLLDAKIDDDGVLSFGSFVYPENEAKYAGVLAYFYDPVNQTYYQYDKVLSPTGSYKLSLGGVQLAKTVSGGSVEYSNYTGVALQPFYLTDDGQYKVGQVTYLTFDTEAEYYTRTGMTLFSKSSASTIDKEVSPDDGDYDPSDKNGHSSAVYDETIGVIQNLKIENTGGLECHGHAADGFESCFSLTWQNPSYDKTKYIGYYEFSFAMDYSYAYYYTSTKLTKDSCFLSYYTKDVKAVDKEHKFCAHDFCSLLGFNDSDSYASDYLNTFKITDLKRIYVRLVLYERSGTGVKTGDWAVFDVDYSKSMLSYNKKELGDGSIYSGDSDLDSDGDFTTEKKDTIEAEKEENSVFGFDVSDVVKIGEYFLGLCQAVINLLGSFPSLFARVFSFLPSEIITIIYLGIVSMVVAGILKIFL